MVLNENFVMNNGVEIPKEDMEMLKSFGHITCLGD